MQKHHDSLKRINGLNYVELTPISFLQRACSVYADLPAIVYGNRRYSWKEVGERCKRIANALKKMSVTKGTTVAFIATNTPEIAEAHFAIPMSGAVLNTINTRLDADIIAYILEHGDAKVLFTDTQFSDVVKQALAKLSNPPLVIDIVDDQVNANIGRRLGDKTYDDLLKIGEVEDDWGFPQSEWDSLALNYTSGTSGRPKGVVYHHRGSYLMSMGSATSWHIPKHAHYLCIVPLFHCNGWGHVWTIALIGGTLYCNRAVTAENIFNAIRDHQITHFGAAPTVLSLLANAPKEMQYRPEHTVQVMTAGAPPPSKILEQMQNLGFNVIHVYGLTETFGHVLLCDWRSAWSELTIEEQAEIKARQGVKFPMMESADVVNINTGEQVSADGKTIGEIVLRGNPIMKGYYKNPQATAEAFKDGWFHSGDLAVLHEDGYIEIKDRLKDIIISGGENISSVEVESMLYKHPKVSTAAVVAKADEKWGETPCAFIELKANQQASAEEIIAFCKENMSGFKCPKHVVFMELPKTSTGKIQKFKLREIIKNN